MKAILKSCKPKILVNILNRKATVLIAKKFPEDYKGWVYIYCTKEEYLTCDLYTGKARYHNIPKGKSNFTLSGKVVARFYCDKVEEIYGMYDELGWNYEFKNEEELLRKSCLDNEDLGTYLKICNNNDFQKVGYAIHISNLEIFDKPKELKHFRKYCEKTFNEYSCIDCKAYKVDWDLGNWCKKSELGLTKAPQSWCYVEAEE